MVNTFLRRLLSAFPARNAFRIRDQRLVNRRSRQSFFEPLERREVFAALVYVNDTWIETTNGGGTAGVVDAGDTVMSNTAAGDTAISGLTFGTQAFATVNDGLTAVDVAGTVSVLAGTYVESVQVSKPVTFLGQQSGVDGRARAAPLVNESIIQGPGAIGARRSPFEINAAGAGTTVDGFILQNGDSANFAPAGIWLVSGTSGNEIRNNIISNNTTGIFVANNSAVDQTVIEKNRFSDNSLAGPASGQDIYADNFTAGAGMQNVLIQNNLFTNTAFTAGSWAVGLSNVDATVPFTNVLIRNNAIENKGRGMYFYGTSASEVSGNTITGTTRYGVGFFAANGGVSNSAFTVTTNTFTNNDKGVWIADDTAAVAYLATLTLTGNTFTTTGTQNSIFNDSVTEVDATDNTFNGVLASTATTAQQFAIVDTIVDGVDVSGAALVSTKAGNVYVTLNSFSSSPDLAIYGPTAAASVQRGIDQAVAGDVVNIQTGTYADGALTSGSAVTLAPGATQGQVVLGGDLVLDANDALALELNGLLSATEYDNFVTTGATLGDAKLNLTVNFSPAVGSQFTIVDNTGANPVSGIFTSSTGTPLPEGTEFVVGSTRFTISYVGGTGNDVVLTVIPAPNTPPTVSNPLPDIIVNAGTPPRTINLDNYFTDDQQATLTYSAVSSDGTVVKAIVTGNLLTLRFAPSKAGIADVTVTATDSSGEAISDTFQVTVRFLPSVSLQNGQLRIVGTAGTDVITVVENPSTHQTFVFAYIGESRFRIFNGNNINSIYVNAGAGNDVVTIGDVVTKPTTILGGAGNDVLTGGLGRDLIYGGTGNDIISGRNGNDVLLGGAGDDRIYGGLGNDVLSGNAGNDYLFGDQGIDILLGGTGKDTLDDYSGRDLLIGSSTANESNVSALRQAVTDWVAGNLTKTKIDLGLITDDGVLDALSTDGAGGDVKIQ